MAPHESIDFTSLIMGFSSAALTYLGVGENPSCGSRRISLSRVKILTFCKYWRKDAGNLTSEEDKLLRNILADLRLKFANAVEIPLVNNL